MGCVCNKLSSRSSKRTPNQSTAKDSKPRLTESQKAIIRNTWRILKQHVSNIGVATFYSMFEERPYLKLVFSKFRDKDLSELHTSGLIRVHALRVMATFDKCVMRLDEPTNLANILKDIGEHHKVYNITQHHVQNLLPFFLRAIRHHLDDSWSEEVEAAWRAMFELMLYHMKKSMEPGTKLDPSVQ